MVERTLQVGRLPEAEDFAAGARRKSLQYTGFAILLGLAVCLPMLLGLEAPVLPLVVLIAALTPILIWHYPALSFYITFGAVCLFEMFPTPYADSLTDRVPFFWNFNTIVQVYTGADFKGIPLNLVELLLGFAGACALVRGVFTRTLRLEWGSLGIPIGIYMGFVSLGWVNGLLTGGDFKLSLQEVRAQFYLLAAYLMAVNIVRNRKQVHLLLWMMVGCIGLKGLLYTFRRYVTLAGLPLPDQGVGSHEEAFFFNTFVALVLVFCFCGEMRGWRYLWVALIPIVVSGNLATNRRAATAAMIVAIPILFLVAIQMFPKKRAKLIGIGVVFALGSMAYYQMFKYSESAWAQPAQAVRSQFEPDARDASSNAYRDAENACLMATIHASPVLGYGYGKRMIHAVAIADISELYEWWDLLPHNQVLWVWMRVGSVGFLAFWMMIAAIVIKGCTLARDAASDSFQRAIALFVVLCVAMLLIFGLLDLQLSNMRDMLFAGTWIGVLVQLPRLAQQQPGRTEGRA